jgi:hypothetical protein
LLSEFYHLRRTAIKDVSAYIGFLAGFIGAAPFAWGLLSDQLASGEFVKGLWYFFGIVVAAGIFTGIAGLGFGIVAGILWEQFHRYRRRGYLKKRAPTEPAVEPPPAEEVERPRLRIVRDDDRPGASAGILLVGILASLSIVASAQNLPTLVGTWRGTSKCLVRPSACHDEDVVYYITRYKPDRTKFSLRANKIVNGVEEDMGTLEPCTYTARTHAIYCPMPRTARPGDWKFKLTNNSLDGGLWLPDGRKFRDVHVLRIAGKQ